MSLDLVFGGSGGVGDLFISDIKAAKDLSLLLTFNIRAVASIARGGQLIHPIQDIPEYLYIAADDTEDFDLGKHLSSTFQFIDMARAHTNVLVHCASGVSRSATVAAAYLIRKYRLPLSDVLSMMRTKRPMVNPNKGFIKILLQEESEHVSPLCSPAFRKEQSKKSCSTNNRTRSFRQESISREKRSAEEISLAEVMLNRRKIEEKIAELRKCCLMEKTSVKPVSQQLAQKYRLDDNRTDIRM